MTTMPFTEDELEVIDRSALEPWATCPTQGYLLASGKLTGEPLDVGSEVHGIISAAVAERQENGAQPRELRDLMSTASYDSRPDIQPRVAHVVKIASWSIVQLICFKDSNNERHPDDLLCYDGGKDDRTGQIAEDLEVDGTAYRLTCELDALMATDSPEELDYLDWKSGWTHWTASDVRVSFQFQFYAWVMLNRYPKVNRVRIRVFMCGESSSTGVVEFDRKDMYLWQRRIMSALRLRASYKAAESAGDVEAWPQPDRCATCPVAVRCAEAARDDVEVAVDPENYLGRYIAMDAATSKMKAILTVYTRKLGHDLEAGGNAFGCNRPKAARAAPMDAYALPSFESDSERAAGPADRQ